MPAVTNFPMRRIAEFLALQAADRSCCVSSPRSPVFDPVAGWAAKGMRFCLRALHALVVCSFGGRRDSGFDRSWFPEVRLEQSPWSAEISVRAPFLQFFPCSPSVTRSVLFPRPAARRVSASLAKASALRVSVSRKSFVQRTQKHFPDPPKKTPLGTWERGTLASLRARVSRGSSGQKPTWRKSSWHSTKTPSA